VFHKFDLHTHSCASDGSDHPAEIVRAAKTLGIELLALSDHDTVRGIAEAQAEADRLGVSLLPAVEMGTEFSEELHILGYDIDIQHAPLLAALDRADRDRSERNERMMDKLAALGMDVRPHMPKGLQTFTRMHVALALVAGGYVKTTNEAFDRYLKKGRPAYAAAQRLQPKDAIELIRSAGGIAVLAHPCLLKCNAQQLIPKLIEYGLQGVEAYYPASSVGQTKEFCSIAKRCGLMITSGSDYHGAHRPKSPLGCAWTERDALEETYGFFMQRLERRKNVKR